MTRWTMLAIAFAVVACSKGERDRLSKDASDAGGRTGDSAMQTARGAVDSALDTARVATDRALHTDQGGAGMKTTDKMETGRGMSADSAAKRASAGTERSTGPTGAQAMGGTRTPTTRLDLSADQTRRLQTALNTAGCDAGAADGVVGRQTRQAIACGLKKNNLRSNDLRGLYRSLSLDF